MTKYFYKGNKKQETEDLDKKISNNILQALDVRNLSFLLGAGCSSYEVEGKEIGIPTMKGLAEEYYGNIVSQSRFLKLLRYTKNSISDFDTLYL